MRGGSSRTRMSLVADAVSVLALTQPGAAKIKTQCREAEAVQRLRGMEDDFIMQCAAEHRVRMADQGGVTRVLCAGIQ